MPQDQFLLPFILSAGLLDSINPCAIGILLLFITLMFTLDKKRREILLMGAFYIAGVYFTYLAIGAGLLKVAHLFGRPHAISYYGSWIAIIVGMVTIISHFSCWVQDNVARFFRFSLGSRQKMSDIAYKASLPAAVLVGAFVAICEFPCTGGIYLAITGLLASKTTFLVGFLYLLIYNLMFVLPLILIYALATNKIVVAKMVDWQEQHREKMKLISGVIMILVGALILTLFV